MIEVLSDQYLNKKEFTSSARRTGVEAEPNVQLDPVFDSRSKLKANSVVEFKVEHTVEAIAASETEGVITNLIPKVNKRVEAPLNYRLIIGLPSGPEADMLKPMN